jgi:hypothetical protein
VRTRAVHASKRLLRFLCAEARSIAHHHLGKTDDGIQRSSQLMAHTGKKLRLMMTRHLELAAFLLYFIEQAHVLDSDGRLIGKGADQLDLLVRKRANVRSR